MALNKASEDPKKGIASNIVLEPDNPLLEKFQKALKEHLLRQIDQLKADVFEYECGTKKNNAKREELGVLVYETQQNVSKQQAILDNCITKLETVKGAREEVENVLVEKRELFKNERNRLIDEENKEVELRNEVESINLLIQQMSQWEDNLESDLTTKKRIYEKSRKDKLKLIADKRQQDALIYKLITRIWKLEQELDKMDVQLKVKEEEREEMAQAVAIGNTNIDAIQAEYRALMHSWNSVVVAVGNRDKVLSCLGSELMKVEEHFKSVHSEIEQVKKLTQNEEKKNEMLTIIKTRFMSDNQKCKTNFENEMIKKITLEKRMIEMTGIIDQTNQDIDKIKDEVHDAKMLLESNNHEFDILNSIKGEFELKIVTALEDQVTSNKSMLRCSKTLNILKMRNKEVEIQLAALENKISTFTTGIESHKAENKEYDKYLNELTTQKDELEREADKYQDEIKKMDFKIKQRQREMDYLAEKYQRTLEKSMTTDASSPMETKISLLARSMEELQEQNKKMQQFWLREQTNLLNISQQRQTQIQNNDLIRKQIMIMEQKNLKVSDELEAIRRYEHKVTRSIINLGNRLAMLSDTVCKTKDLKKSMGKDSDMLRQDYIFKLKDAELECLQLEDEINEIEQDKVALSQELVDMNREALVWERKLLCAKETKATMKQERGNEGEVGGMKAEIHRMNVRYSQLKKVQDVLVHDLEHCVARRDAIMTITAAREKRTKGAVEKTRINFNRKLDDMRNKIKQMQNEIDEIDAKMVSIDKEKNGIDDKIQSYIKETETIKQNRTQLCEEIEEILTQKQLNLEWLVQIQKKLSIYSDLARGIKPRLLFKSESGILSEYQKRKEINGKLIKIVENLREDFPQLHHDFTRFINTLTLPILITIP